MKRHFGSETTNVTKHMCFTIESGPCHRGARTGTHRPSPSAAPAHKNETSKFSRDGGEEEETLYIRSRIEAKVKSQLWDFMGLGLHFDPRCVGGTLRAQTNHILLWGLTMAQNPTGPTRQTPPLGV